MRWVIALSAAAWVLIGAIVVTVRGPKPSAPLARVEVSRAKDDPACRAAWAAARGRFFGGGFDGGRP